MTIAEAKTEIEELLNSKIYFSKTQREALEKAVMSLDTSHKYRNKASRYRRKYLETLGEKKFLQHQINELYKLM